MTENTEITRTLKRTAWLLLAGVACALTLGCATSNEVIALRQELGETRRAVTAAQDQAASAAEQARQANARADAAAQQASAAAAQAQAASDKADKIFQKALRK